MAKQQDPTKEIRYHVTKEWDGEDLQPLAKRIGENEAIEVFLESWPDTDASMANDHVWKIFFYKSLEEAQEHQGVFGGEILEIDADILELETDLIEGYEHTSFDIPKEFIRKVK